MKQWIEILAVTLALLVGPALAQAGQGTPQAPATLASLEISLWPEYDRPGVLVMYRGTFAGGTTEPLAVEISIPGSVGRPSAVAFVTEDGSLFNQAYTTRLEGDRLVVSFELSAPGFQIEYYAPLTLESGRRSFEFSYTADYAVENLTLEVQEPPTSRGFQLEPPADSSNRLGDGLTYHIIQAGAVAAGERKACTLTYNKEGDELTSPEVTAATAAPEAATEGDEHGGSTLPVVVVAALGVLAVGAGAFWLGRRTQRGPSAPSAGGRQAGRGTTSGRAAEQRSTVDGGKVYCRQCGAQMPEDAEYCPKCGTRVRRIP